MNDKTFVVGHCQQLTTEPPKVGLSSVKRMVSSFELQKTGGVWLGAARSYLQHHIRGGDTNTWGSNQTVTMTMAQVEEMAAEIAAAAINESR